MDEEEVATVEPQDVEAPEMEAPIEQAPETDVVEEAESKTQVPLSALLKERRKKQELEIENRYLREREQRASQPTQEESDPQYETVSKQDLSRSSEETVRLVEERIWIKQNPEAYDKVTQNLEEFLKQRPNLRSAIQSASNRYEEAYTLMEALSPKQRQQVEKPQQKKPAPGSPTGVPKAAAMNQAVDVMSMSDTEFTAWRNNQRKRR